MNKILETLLEEKKIKLKKHMKTIKPSKEERCLKSR